MRKNRSFHRKLRLESLEGRAMLAGNVTASVDGAGTLKIKGDDLANQIAVVADTGTPGDFRVDGLGTTTINGAGSTASFTGVVNIDIDMQKASDEVHLNDEMSHTTTLAGNLTVKLADGNDELFIGDGFTAPAPPITSSNFVCVCNEFTVGGAVDIKAGKGDDRIDIRNLNVGGDTVIDTSDGLDWVRINNDCVSGTKSATHFEGNLDISLGLHDDDLHIRYVEVAEELTIGTSKGDDEVYLGYVQIAGGTEIDTSDGDDVVEIYGGGSGPTSFAGLEINLGLHDDFLIIGGSTMYGPTGEVTIEGDLDIGTSRGDDEVHLWGIVVDGATELATSDGVDCVEIRDSIFDDLEVNLGHGDDHLLIGGTTIDGSIDLNGSAGYDRFYDGSGNSPSDLTPYLRSFEYEDEPWDFPCPLYDDVE